MRPHALPYCVALGFLGISGLAACSSEPSALQWSVRLDSAERPASRIVAEVREGGCGGATLARWERIGDQVSGNDSLDLPKGRYGLFARASDASCLWYASGCTELTLPLAKGALPVIDMVPESESPRCVAALCQEGACPSACERNEGCDGQDNDCDGAVDEAAGYIDRDLDGFGDSRSPAPSVCENSTLPIASGAGDCNDANAAVYLGAVEECNGIDDDCDGKIDEDADRCAPCTRAEQGGKTYLLCSSGAPWLQAESFCRSRGYQLITIESAAEQDWAFAQRTVLGNDNIWIGFNDRGQERNFTWSSGIVSTYTNWDSGQPDNNGAPDGASNEEDCAHIRGPSGRWNDILCGGPYFPFICESNP